MRFEFPPSMLPCKHHRTAAIEHGQSFSVSLPKNATLGTRACQSEPMLRRKGGILKRLIARVCLPL
jgi:hypothetical protein